MKSKELYKSNIIEHYKNPRNTKRLDNSTHHTEVSNTTCGDEIELWLDVQDGIVKEVAHETRGCAICVASMSMLSQWLKGRDLAKLDDMDMEGFVLEQLQMEKGSGRIKCAMLSVEGVKRSLAPR